MYNVLDICRYIINYSNENNYTISNLNLQKILYFIQIRFLIDEENSRPCFNEKIEAWNLGPVVPAAYKEYKQYGASNISTTASFTKSNIESDNDKTILEEEKESYNDFTIKDDDKKLIDEVVDLLAYITVTNLINITHNQKPWKDAYKKNKNNEITLDAIREYFSDDILKTDNNFVTLSHDNNSSAIKEKKIIKDICKSLNSKDNQYDPQTTVDHINDFLNINEKHPILYSKINNQFYSFLNKSSKEVYINNINTLLEYALDESNNIDDNCKKTIIKIYEYSHLIIYQIDMMKKTADSKIKDIEELFSKTIEENEKNQSDMKNIMENFRKELKGVEKGYISILGIFSSIILTFVGGITFSSSVLENINNSSIYRLLITIDLLAFILINVIYILLKFILIINGDKDDNKTKLSDMIKIKEVNIILILFAVGVVAMWIFFGR